ncbi:MAG: Rrf2 family transcriptional regulator [Planctomycetota bacterium]|nr:Rrf2 family transcriptional regulator [Planctomycetota bacterium]
MKLSQKAEYALRAMIHLARESAGGGARPATQIAKDEELPEKFLEQILSDLRKQGLVKSRRGAVGGYNLARAGGKITVGEVLRAMDGPLVPRLEVSAARSGSANLTLQCLRLVWRKLAVGISGVVDNLTLQDLCDTVEEQGAALDYSI